MRIWSRMAPHSCSTDFMWIWGEYSSYCGVVSREVEMRSWVCILQILKMAQNSPMTSGLMGIWSCMTPHSCSTGSMWIWGEYSIYCGVVSREVEMRSWVCILPNTENGINWHRTHQWPPDRRQRDRSWHRIHVVSKFCWSEYHNGISDGK